MRPKHHIVLFFLPLLLLVASCDKGYQVRFTNYYIEPMDSVIIGNNYIVFTDIDLESTTDYKKLMSGKHWIRYVSRTNKKFYSTMVIPSKGSGKRTVQIDGIEQISILEE
jgi:hypothetical protein